MTVEELGDQYCLIGPYNESCVRTEVEATEPQNDALAKTLQQMRDHGIKVKIVVINKDVRYYSYDKCYYSVKSIYFTEI